MSLKKQGNEAVVFGAGNIGRSFIGNIFAVNGWKVTFVDSDRRLVDLLNSRGGYRIRIKRGGLPDKIVEVEGISAVHSGSTEEVIRSLQSCRICSTSVGQNALKYVVPVIASAVSRRMREGAGPLDVIIAENIRGGAEYFRTLFREAGLEGNEAGLIETSIGKMVPIMKAEDLAVDPLVLNAEEYNTLILDKKGFRNEIPDFPEIKAVENISAWVDRKLFIHNLGHAAAAYLGYESRPDLTMISEVVSVPALQRKVRAAMEQSAEALRAEYPDDFTAEDLAEHIDDLLSRFSNSALGDTVFRVGRDLKRKLNRNDRILGAAALCLEHGLKADAVIEVFRAALSFRAAGPDGKTSQADRMFHEKLNEGGVSSVITVELGLTESDAGLRDMLEKAVS